MRVRRFRSPAPLVLALGLSACAVGPDFHRPAAPEADRYTAAPLPAADAASAPDAQRYLPGADVPAQWWRLFHSPELDALVRQALQANPTLQSAQAALRAAQENVRAQQGAYYPSVQASYNPARQKIAPALASPLASNATFYNLHTAQVTVGFVPDVFGANRRQVESLEAQADAQRFQLEAAYVTLSSNVVAAAIQEAALRAQRAATEETIRVAQEQLEISRRQLALGAIAEAAVIAQEAALAQAQATLPPLAKQLAIQRDLLTALVGRLPHEELTQRFELASLQLPAELPLSLPSKLVEQRPDVRIAEAQLHQASAQIGVAKANMLPQFNLTASTGNVSEKVLGQLFSSSNAFWSVAATVTQPIFQGGTLLHRKRAAEALYDQAAAQYRATVLAAFQNVADTLHALQADAEGLRTARVSEAAAGKSLEIARRQMALGDISYLALLSAEQAYQTAVITRVQAQAAQLADTAALFQALGGGWWNREEGKS